MYHPRHSFFPALSLVSALALAALPLARAAAGKENGELDIYWTDVEGGAATLIVTPVGESILIDTGMPGERDPARIVKTVREVAGLERLDHLVVTHFDIDHYGGTADVMARVPVGKVHDPGLPEENEALMKRLASYLQATAGKRLALSPGGRIPLEDAPPREGGSTPLGLACLAANQKLIASGPPAGECAKHPAKAKDESQNANSIVLLLSFGEFRFLDAADLTWNLEHQLVCPQNLVGEVDVYQVDHHGLDVSNNPALIEAIRPAVAIMNNGPRKGCEPNTWRTLKESGAATFQLHRNVRVGPEGNTQPSRIANDEERCAAEIIHLAVSPGGREYRVSIPAKSASESFQTKPKKVKR
jgi:beta-lactamase superfamily II metal-dependent hydrolase